MCGRTVCHRAPDDVCRACRHSTKNGRKAQPKWRDPPGGQKYQSSYNMAPTSFTPILLSKKHLNEAELSECVSLETGEGVASAGTGEELDESDFVVQPMHWGLVPAWHQGDSSKTVGLNLTNARSDGLLSKKTFKTPLEKGRRCVVLMDGFYEWQKKDDKKIPHYIYVGKKVKAEEDVDVKIKEEIKAYGEGENPMLKVAGLFDIWKNKEGQQLYSYSIITVDAHKDLAWLHHRMPAVLQTDEEVESWLNFGSVPLNKALQVIRPIGDVQSHPVSNAVGNVHNKSPDLILPVDPDKKKKPSASSNFMSAWLKKSDKTPKKETSEEIKQKRKSDPGEIKTEIKDEEIKQKRKSDPGEIKTEIKDDCDPEIPSKKPKLE